MKSFGRSLLDPVPLLTFASSVVTSSFTHAWWLLPVGALASCIVAAVGADPPKAVSDELADCTPDERIKLTPLMQEKARILAELRREDANPFLNAADVESRVDSVVASYRHLLEKLGELRPLLDPSTVASLARSIEDLERHRNASTDDVTRETLTQAILHRKDEQKRLAELGRSRDRVQAQLLSLASALTNLRVRLVQNRVSEASAAEPAIEINESLEGLFREVEVAEKTSLELGQLVTNDDRKRRRQAAATQAR